MGGRRGRLFCYYPAAPEEGRGQQAACLCLPVSKPISPNREERKEGVTWQTHSYYEISGVHFNPTWPCQGHHMPACVPGLLETRCYWTKAAAPQRHTQQLFSVATYHLMTLMEGKATQDCNTSSVRGNNSHSSLLKNTQRYRLLQQRDNQRNSNVEEPVEQWKGLSIICVGHFFFPSLASLLKATKTRVNKSRRKHGGSCFRWLKDFQENIFPVTSTELMNFH